MICTQKPHPVDVACSGLVAEDPRAGYYDALREAEERGARIVLDAIADTGFFGITGEYGDVEKRDAFICRTLAANPPYPRRVDSVLHVRRGGRPVSILAFAPMHNTPGKRDATGAFQPEARAFVKLHGGIIALIDNHARPLVQRRQVHAAISEVGPSVVAFFCHGWRTGIQFGIGMAHLDALAAAISGASYGPTIALYCCSTGSGPGIGGDGGFADGFRDALCRAGADFCQIDAHTTAGHCTRNPNVRRFEGMGSPTGGAGGYYIVSPGSSLWSRWRAALAGDLRLRFPLMTVGEIHHELAAG